jgi:glycosyltransferase involved in cell wall biosynthesis
MIPTYSVVIPWCDRPELLITLERNRAIYERHATEIVVVNAGGDYEALTALAKTAGMSNVRCIDLPGAAFNRSLCANIGALVSRGEIVFLLDADIVLNSDVLAEACQCLENGARYVTISHILESHVESVNKPDDPDLSFLAELRETRELLTVDGRRAVLRHVRSPRGRRTGDGLVLVRKRDLLGVGGLNSMLTGWGYEDTDLQIRLQFVLGLERMEAGEVTHLTHSDTTRDSASWGRNMAISTRNYSRQHYKGSFDDDARTWTGKYKEVCNV